MQSCMHAALKSCCLNAMKGLSSASIGRSPALVVYPRMASVSMPEAQCLNRETFKLGSPNSEVGIGLSLVQQHGRAACKDGNFRYTDSEEVENKKRKYTIPR